MSKTTVTIELFINSNKVLIMRECELGELDEVLDWAAAYVEINGDPPAEEPKRGRPKKVSDGEDADPAS